MGWEWMGMDGMGWDLRVDRRFEARKRSDIERIEGGEKRDASRGGVRARERPMEGDHMGVEREEAGPRGGTGRRGCLGLKCCWDCGLLPG
jgi:hypothetical protein